MEKKNACTRVTRKYQTSALFMSQAKANHVTMTETEDGRHTCAHMLTYKPLKHVRASGRLENTG